MPPLLYLDTPTRPAIWVTSSLAGAAAQVLQVWRRDGIPKPHLVGVIEFPRWYFALVVNVINHVNRRCILFGRSCLLPDTRLEYQ